MSGICGVVYRDRRRIVNPDKFLEMRDSMTHRGPDDSGYYLAPGIALASRRLAVLDLSERGHMPMKSRCGRYQIIFNGEIYNHKELRASLEARGFVFDSQTDTEVLLNLYLALGPSLLSSLNGMFAFAIWDDHERSLLVARDRLGIKPVYYALHDGGLFFASEEKALFAVGVPRQFDQNVWGELLCFRSVNGERTLFSGIRRLLPGHYIFWQDGVSRMKRWWNLADMALAQRENLPADAVGWFRETFDSAVNLSRSGDVPMGVLLTGGVNSFSVAASLSTQAGCGMDGFAVSLNGLNKKLQKDPVAQRVADRWQLKFHKLEVGSQELFPLLRLASRLNDQPLAHAGDVELLALAKYARSHVSILLSGVGGDDLLSLHERYRPLLYPLFLRLALLTGFASSNSSRPLKLGAVDRFILYHVCEVLPADLKLLGMKPLIEIPYREAVLAEAKAVYPDEPLRQAMYCDQHTLLCALLERNDRMSMGASIECRMPFLDHRLVEVLAALPSAVFQFGRKRRSLLRRSVGSRLPSAVLHQRAAGAPWSHYLRQNQELKEIVHDLPRIDLIKDGPFDPRRVKELVRRFEKGDNSNEPLIRQLVWFAIWDRAR